MNHATDCSPATIESCYRAGFTLGEHSARHLRRILRTFLTRWEMPGLTDAAELALTELVANVVRHVPGRRCTLLILRRPDGLRVEVGDENPYCPRPARPERGGDELDEGGRGLLLVEAVTDRWGVIPVPGGKTMWFECDA
ncbi:ATP-binding protein [Streptomyces sp.]|uniref:ATP-binding protein n=1 Tax=Streptomyces sp. TaxID=1931 RepID=UPI002D781DB3|nr:ATP-binding protein [Streptomyces sp.]HET6356313.1 ATP-binding protein [Streptomyces sp.]